MAFFRWRAHTIDFLFENIIDGALIAEHLREVAATILQTFKGYFKAELEVGGRFGWDELVHVTEFVVATAADLALNMRRSQDGVWLPFHPTPGSGALAEAVSVHKDTAVALPPRQTDLLADSKVTMTVVPGLIKHTSEKDMMPGEMWSQVVKRTRRRAKCFVDLLPTHITGEQYCNYAHVPQVAPDR